MTAICNDAIDNECEHLMDGTAGSASRRKEFTSLTGTNSNTSNTSAGLTLFPTLTPFNQGLLTLDHGHQMHWKTSGNPRGLPVIWLHGGPGSSAGMLHRRLLDPDKFLIIQYDQRGCGLSEPRGATHANTTTDLIADIERLRGALALSRWSVVGSSWGGALALLYAQAHADVIERMLLRSSFLCTALEVERFLRSPPAQCSASWQQFQRELPKHGAESILDCGYRVFCQDNDIDVQTRLARAWVAYETAMDAHPMPATSMGRLDDHALITRYQIHTHYLKHRCFVEQTVLHRPQALRGIDLVLVHGNQDVVCPFENSLIIQQAVPSAHLVPVVGAGHNMFDERMIAAMLSQTQRWARHPV